MSQVNEVVEKFVKPYLAKHHPDAALVIMAGSYGRAMKSGQYQPIASSDIDLVIIYTDLEKGGFKAATQIFSMEDVGKAMGGDSRIMMIDTNIHDLASLHYHDKTVKENSHMAFINVMLDEGSVIVDKLGIGPVLQEKATKFLNDGPTGTPQPVWQGEIERLETYRRDIAAAGSTEEKRFLGLLSMIHVCEYVLGLHKYWRSGSNQAYRSMDRKFPEDGAKITESYSKLLRQGDASGVVALLDEYIARGRALLPTLPAQTNAADYTPEQVIPADELKAMKQMNLKFMTEHLCEALGTSQRRGEQAWMENISATTVLIKTAMEIKSGQTAGEGMDAIRWLSTNAPDLFPIMMQALDEGVYEPVVDQANKALDAVGGIHYSHLQKYYIDDVARVYAKAREQEGPAAPAAPKKWFNPGFKP